MDLTQHAREQITSPRVIVFPEGDDAIVAAAAAQLGAGSEVVPVLIGAGGPAGGGPADGGPAGGGPAGSAPVGGPPEPVPAGPIRWIERPRDHPRFAHYVDQFSRARQMPHDAAALLVDRPLFFAAMMVATGDAHGMVAGITCPTEDVIVAGQLCLGPESDDEITSSFYLLEIPGRPGDEPRRLAFADPAMNPVPTAGELARIARSTARAVHAMLGWEPRVAMLSFSTRGSAEHPAVEVVREACALLTAQNPDFAVDGELQADAALDPRIARRKLGADSPVAGRANVLVLPNLDAANIGAKLVIHLAGARAYGPFLCGLRAPVSDLSRGACVDDVVGTAILVAAARRPSPVRP